MIAQIFMGHDRVFAVTIFTIQLTLNGAVTAGYLGNGLDIAPNFSGTIFGLANTLSSLSGFLSAFMVGSLTKTSVSSAADEMSLSSHNKLVTNAIPWVFLEHLRTVADRVRNLGGDLHRWCPHLPVHGLGRAAALEQSAGEEEGRRKGRWGRGGRATAGQVKECNGMERGQWYGHVVKYR